MAKFKAEYESDTPKYTLTFRGQEFSFSMVPCKYGTQGDKPVFSQQLAKAFPELDESELDDDIEVNMLDCSFDDENKMFLILERLEELE